MARKRYGKRFQRHVVACMSRIPEFAARVYEILDPEYFSDESSADAIAFLRVYWQQYNALPSAATLVQELEDEDFVAETYADDIDDVAYVTDEMVEYCRDRAMQNAVLESAELIKNGKHDEVRGKIDAALMVGTDFGDMGDWLHDIEGREKRYLVPESRDVVPTGMSHIDEILRGGVERGELGVIMAPTKRGKSFMLANIGYGAISRLVGVNAVHYSFELSARRVIERYDSRLANKSVKYKYSAPPKFIQALYRRHSVVVQGQLLSKFWPTRKCTPTMLRSHLSQVFGLGYEPSVVIVDYGDIMKPDRRLGEARHEQAGIFEDLRAIAGEFNVALWTATQTNRASLSKQTITLQDVAESFEKVQIADAILAMCQTEEEKNKGKMRLFVAGLRNEPDGRIINCDCDFDRALIKTTGIETKVARRKSDKKKRGDEKAMKKSIQKAHE